MTTPMTTPITTPVTAPAASPGLRVQVRLPLDRFELSVDLNTEKQVTGIFGASGAGKTSVLEAVCGIRRHAQGIISLGHETWLDSQRGVCVKPWQRHIGYVPQGGLLFPHKNVRQNLLAGKKRAVRNGYAVRQTFETAVHILELGPLLERTAHTLSGGERQRVALGRAICSGPRLLLLDEPFASLDLALRRKLLPFLRRVRSEFQIPMLFVSHDPLEVQALCDDLIVLQNGRMIAHGAPRAVLTDPQVFPLAEQQGFENVLPCRMVDDQGSTSRVRLGEAEVGERTPVELVTIRSEARPGEAMLASIPASDIMLASKRPEGLSARNILPARITQLHSVGHVGLATAELSPDLPPLTVEVTERSFVELGLKVGSRVFLVIKAMSCRLYWAEGPVGSLAGEAEQRERGLVL